MFYQFSEAILISLVKIGAINNNIEQELVNKVIFAFPELYLYIRR